MFLEIKLLIKSIAKIVIIFQTKKLLAENLQKEALIVFSLFIIQFTFSNPYDDVPQISGAFSNPCDDVPQIVGIFSNPCDDMPRISGSFSNPCDDMPQIVGTFSNPCNDVPQIVGAFSNPCDDVSDSWGAVHMIKNNRPCDSSFA